MKQNTYNKSHFLSSLQCKEKLRRELNEEITESDAGQLLFRHYGCEVGEAARKLFPTGILIDQHLDLKSQLDLTKTLIKDSLDSPLFEAGFSYQQFLSKADILEFLQDGTLALSEVKAKTTCSKEHLYDLAFQVFVIENATGKKVTRCNLIYLNSEFELTGPLEVEKLFVVQDVSEEILSNDSVYTNEVVKFCSFPLDSRIEYSIGPHCSSPHVCPYKEDCFSKEDTILNLRRSTNKWSFLRLGKRKLGDVVNDKKLTAYQELQAQSEKSDKTIIDKAKLKKFLKRISGITAFLDFESISLPIPIWDRVRVYQHVVFQASIHIAWIPDAMPGHFEFLNKDYTDPSEKLVLFLIRHLSEVDNVIVYYEAFEKARIRELQSRFPKYALELEEILVKIIDLEKVFSQGLVVSHKFKGSTSIKKVLGVICPELSTSYEDLLHVNNGQAASYEYYKFLRGNLSEKETKKSFKALSKYCELDTISLWYVLNKLIILTKGERL